MKTQRTGVERNKKQVYCRNSSWLGFSSSVLRYGDFFIVNGTLFRCHGQVRPKNERTWMILAQTVTLFGKSSFERWVDPEAVEEVCPKVEVAPELIRLFERLEEA